MGDYPQQVPPTLTDVNFGRPICRSIHLGILVSLSRQSPQRESGAEAGEGVGISEQEVVKTFMLKETADGEFTRVADVAETTLFPASFPLNA